MCSSVFRGIQSASLDIWTPLDNFFGQDDLLSLSLSVALCLFLSLPVCLSVCLSLSLYLSLSLSLSLSSLSPLSLSHSNSVIITLSLFLSLSHLPLVLSSRIDICLHVCKTLVRTALFQNSKAAPSSSRPRVEVVVVGGLPLCHVVHVHSTICKACEEMAGFYPRRAAKIFSHSRHSSRKNA